jgi:hypothetical protein
MWENLITLVATLSGCLLTGMAQARVARNERRETRWDARRSEALAAVTALVSALADHRRAMWVLEDLRLSHADSAVVADALEASHVTRSALTMPLTTIRILIPALAGPARQATQATYAMRNAPDHAALETLRQEALNTSDLLEEAAAELFAAVGGVLEVAT